MNGGRPRLRAPALVSVPAGEWCLGAREPGPSELPERLARLGPFRAGVAPVTNAEFRLFLEATAPTSSNEREGPAWATPERPVVGVSWHEARAYLDWLSSETGEALRLPTGDEREVAARGGLSGCRWPWGRAEPEERESLTRIATLERPHRPGPECANPWGLSCMADNVHEWCSDAVPGREGAPLRRLSCGGSWRHRVKFTPVAARSSLPPESRYLDYGFRAFADA